MSLHAVTEADVRAAEIRHAWDRFAEIVERGRRLGILTDARADELLTDRALLDSCRLVALGVRP